MTCLLLRDDIQSSALFSFLFFFLVGWGGGGGGGGGGSLLAVNATVRKYSDQVGHSSSNGISKAPSINVRRENGKVAESSLV